MPKVKDDVYAITPWGAVCEIQNAREVLDKLELIARRNAKIGIPAIIWDVPGGSFGGVQDARKKDKKSKH